MPAKASAKRGATKTPAKTTIGSEYLARALEGYGIDHVFYVPAALLRTMAGLETGGTRRILEHSEKTGAYMAAGYARARRRPLAAGRTVVSRANHHANYPARFRLVAAMNPCRCGYLGDPVQGCSRAPRCGADYQSRLSGPFLDRIDLHVELAAVAASELALPPPAEGSAEVATSVAGARALQRARYGADGPRSTAAADGQLLEEVAAPDAPGRELLLAAAGRLKLSARGWRLVLRVARTLAGLGSLDRDTPLPVRRIHIAEALAWRRPAPAR